MSWRNGSVKVTPKIYYGITYLRAKYNVHYSECKQESSASNQKIFELSQLKHGFIRLKYNLLQRQAKGVLSILQARS